MKNAVIVHGKPPRERYEDPTQPKPHKANWLPWLGEQHEAQGVAVSIPALPKPYFPVYEDWKQVFPAAAVGPETAVVAHSAGVEFVLRWLSEDTQRCIERAVLIARPTAIMKKNTVIFRATSLMQAL